MDTKRTITIILVLMAVVLFWERASSGIFKMMGWDLAAVQHKDEPTTAPAVDASSTQPGTLPGSGQSATSMNSALLRPVPATEPSRTAIGSPATNDPQHRLAVNLTSAGAAINSVILNEFKKSVDGAEPYTYQHPYEGFESVSRPLATRAIELDGKTVDVTDREWKLEESSPTSATFSLDLVGPDNKPVARLIKSYQVFSKTDQANGSGYEVQVRQSIRNLTDKPIDTALTFNGPTTPPRELDRGSDRMMIGGYLDQQSVHVMQNYVEAFNAKQAVQDYTKSDKGQPLLWAGTASVYFNALVRPIPADPKQAPSQLLQKVFATSLNPTADDAKAHAVTMTFQTAVMNVAPGASADFVARAFFGPKQRALLKTPYYREQPREYNATLVITSGICGVCTFGWLIDALVWLLNAFHFVLRDWGLSIILLVFIVRLILHPITKKSQQNMANMSKFGPEMEKLKKKYADKPDELNKAMMSFYKEHGATPILGCLPMFLQMPIWIALWQALQTTFELRHAPFLRFTNGLHLTWIKDLSQPDHLISFQHPIQIWLLTISGLNILPILMGIVFFVQQKFFTPKPPTMTPEQEQQQKMMQWMTGLLFPLMLYAGPSGLNLYILTSTTFGIIESKIIRDHIKEREEAIKSGKVIVDAGKKFGRGGGKKKDDDKKPMGKIGSLIASLQARADQAQRDAQRRRGGKA